MGRYAATNTNLKDAILPEKLGMLPIGTENATEDEVPPIVSRSMAHPNTVGTELIAWTTFDAQWESSLYQASCCLTFVVSMFFPFYWPIAVACVPFCLCIQAVLKQELRNTVWILTDQELIVAIDYNLRRSTRHIPLRKITECYCRKPRYCQLPTLFIQIIHAKRDSEGVVHDPIKGYGLVGYDWFHTAILHQRDQVASRTCNSRANDIAVQCAEGASAADFAAQKEQGMYVDSRKLPEMVCVKSSDPCEEDLRYKNIGTLSNLPEDVRSMVYWGSSTVIAWSTLDPQVEPVLFRLKCCYWLCVSVYGMILWIVAYESLVGYALFFVLFGFLVPVPIVCHEGLRNTYWILTDRDLILVTQRYWFVPDKIQYVSLDHIRCCGIERSCSTSSMYIDTPFQRSSKTQHYASAFGLAGSDCFKTAILQQRDLFQACFPLQDREVV